MGDTTEPKQKKRKMTQKEESSEKLSLFELIESDRPYQARKLARLLKEGDVDVNAVKSEGKWAGLTPLIIAILRQCLESVKILVANRADVNTKLKEALPNDGKSVGATPLLLATIQSNMEIAQCLLENGAIVDAYKEDGATSLICAAFGNNIPMIKLLLDHGAKIDFASDESLCAPPLLIACKEGHVDSVELLLKRGASPNVEHKFSGDFPLLTAAVERHHNLVTLLLAYGADVNQTNQDGASAIQTETSFEVLETLLNAGAKPNVLDNEKNFPLFMLCQDENIDQLKLLVERGADVNFQDQDGSVALLPACYVGNIHIVQYLIEKGADVNHGNHRGERPIHAASNCMQRDHGFEIVSFLLSAGADPNVLNKDEGTPLHIASAEGRKDLVVKLLEHHASVSIKNHLDQTPIDVAEDSTITKLLEEYCGQLKPAKR